MRARRCACACMRLRVGTGARKKKKREKRKKEKSPRGGSEGMKSHRFSGNLIKPRGDEGGKTIQCDAPRARKKSRFRSLVSFNAHFDNDFLASAHLKHVRA